MWASRYWADRYWAPRYWAKVGEDPATGAFGEVVIGLAPKRTFTTEGIQLGGGGSLG